MTLIGTFLLTNWSIAPDNWIVENHKNYTFCFKKTDRKYKKEYRKIIDTGVRSVQSFFGDSFPHAFAVYIHPDRHSLDSTWQKDWNMPDFSSECWMVASGVAAKLDVISPVKWDSLACEHKYANQTQTRQLITHELFHVYHGQHNASPDFNDVTGIDWFIEGFATYASGQCDSLRMDEVRKAFSAHKVPAALDQFWTGKLKYGLSGSMVMYIDRAYGRNKLKDLLQYNTKTELLASLGITESGLMAGWETFMAQMATNPVK